MSGERRTQRVITVTIDLIEQAWDEGFVDEGTIREHFVKAADEVGRYMAGMDVTVSASEPVEVIL